MSPFVLEGCVVLPDLNRVARGEEVVQLQPRVMSVLLWLVNRPGEVLSREALFDAVWPDSEVCEEALTRTISDLRRVFGDDPRSPRVIETIRKGGYRLVAPVHPAEEKQVRAAAAVKVPPSETSSGNGSRAADLASTLPFRLGRWRVEPALGRMRINGRTVQLEPRVMHLLVYLARHGGEVVSRQTLLETIWGERGAMEKSLTAAISDLRRLLEDDPDAPRYVETIRGIGYRLLTPVTSERPDRRRGKPLLWISVASIAIVASAFLAHAFRARPRASSPLDWRVRPLTTDLGVERFPALSPDGTRLAFCRITDVDHGFDLWIRPVGEGNALRLTDAVDHEIHPSWSPDGTTVAFVRRGGAADAICTVPATGGMVRKLHDARFRIFGLDWSPGGDELVFAASPNAGDPAHLRVLSLPTMTDRRLTSPPDHTGGDLYPVYSPRGDQIAFARTNPIGRQDVFLIGLGGAPPRQLTRNQHRIAGIGWTPDGRDLVVSASPVAAFNLWRVSIDDGTPIWLPLAGKPVVDPTLSRRGNRLAFEERSYDCNIWSLGITPAGETPDRQRVLIESTRMEYHPVWSPDGRRIAFISTRTGSREIWVCNADASEPRRVTYMNGVHVMAPCWSPDGRRIAFTTVAEGYMNVFVTEIDGGRPARLTAEGRHEISVLWSRESDWIYYRAESEAGWRIWRMRSDGGGREAVTAPGYTLLAEVPGSGDLLCRREGEEGIWRLLPRGDGERLAVSGSVSESWGSIAATAEGILFTRWLDQGAMLGFYDFGTGRSDSLAAMPVNHENLSLSPDGRCLLFDTTQRMESDLLLVDGFW